MPGRQLWLALGILLAAIVGGSAVLIAVTSNNSAVKTPGPGLTAPPTPNEGHVALMSPSPSPSASAQAASGGGGSGSAPSGPAATAPNGGSSVSTQQGGFTQGQTATDEEREEARRERLEEAERRREDRRQEAEDRRNDSDPGDCNSCGF